MEGQAFSGRQARRVNLSGMVPDIAYAGRKLIAFGESADTVPERLRRIGVGACPGVGSGRDGLTGFPGDCGVGKGDGAPFQGSGVLCMVVPGRCPICVNLVIIVRGRNHPGA